MKRFLFLFLIVFSSYQLAQNKTGSIQGKVTDMRTGQPLPGANIIVTGTNLGSASDENGEYTISNIPFGRYSVKASMVGYDPVTETEVFINSVTYTEVNFTLKESVLELEAVTVVSDYFQKDPHIVNSVSSFNYEEIRRSPGGFEDVIRALSVLPGIAQADAGRNDLVVRGGAPSENLYTIDGVVIPNINHFGSQGSTGGPLSFVDLNFVKDVTFSTGGFPAEYGDKLSSVMEIKLAEGRKDRIGGKATISASQFGVNLEGPINNKMNFLFSARRSYLDFIFKAAGFGFVPEYYDVLGKFVYSPDNSNTFSFLFLGAYDNVKFFNNTSDQRYTNSQTLGNDQVQYTGALSFRHLFNNGFFNISLSRISVDHSYSQKDTLLNPIFLNNSTEIENNLKTDFVLKPSSMTEIDFGFSYNFIEFETDIKLPLFVTSFGDSINFNQLKENAFYNKLGAYSQVSYQLSKHFDFNAGFRLDYFNGINNPLTFSPRLSLLFTPNIMTNISFSTGIYHQKPSYIWLAGDNRNKDLKKLSAFHFIVGIERRLREDTQLKVEAFYKIYNDYPVSVLRPYLILSNTGAGFGGSEENFSAFGLEHLVSEGKGNVKGIELQIQKKSSEIPLYGIFSLTYSKALFTALDEIERPGSFDQRIIMNLSGGYIFNEKWEAALKFRFATGRPFTPFNSDGSQNVELYNSQRIESFQSLDLRVDRRWIFDEWALITFVDIQNIYNRKNTGFVRWDERENRVDKTSSIGILPSIGITAEF